MQEGLKISIYSRLCRKISEVRRAYRREKWVSPVFSPEVHENVVG